MDELTDAYLTDLLDRSQLSLRPGWMFTTDGYHRPIPEVRRFAELLLAGRKAQESPTPRRCVCRAPVFTEYSATVYLPDPNCPAHGGVKHIMFVGEKRPDSASEGQS